MNSESTLSVADDLESQVVEGLKPELSELRYDAAKVSGDLKTALCKSNAGA